MVEIGPRQVVRYAQAVRLRGDFQPYLSLALGAAEATLLEMTSAYSAFPNQGVRMAPYSVVMRSRIAKATCSRRTGPSRTRRSAPTPRS